MRTNSNTKTRFLILFATLLLIINPLLAQQPTQTIRGRVIDKQGQFPLPGANIIILDREPLTGTSTDAQGQFRLEQVAAGRISLKVSYMGYKEVVLTAIEHIGGKETVLHVELEESVITGEIVEITANRDKTRPINTLAAVSARGFTLDETQRYAGSRNDVARMASNFAGVQGASDSRNDIIIRGNSPSFLLWRYEGVDIPNPNHWAAFGTTGGPVSILNINVLTNSDFLTGAFPAEYGNALSGAFDLKMRSGNNERHEFVGQMGFNGVELGAEGPLFKNLRGSYLINYRYSTMAVFEKVGMNFGTTGTPYYQDVAFKINLPGTRLGSLSIFGMGGRSTIDLWDSKRDTAISKVDYYGGEGFDLTNGADVAVLGISNTILHSQSFYTKTTLAATYHYSGTRLDSLTPVTLDKTPWYRANLNETKFSASWVANKRFSAKNNLKAGITASMRMLNLYDSIFKPSEQAFKDIRNFEGDAWLLQPYANLNHRFNDAVSLNMGLHYQYFLMNQTSSLEPRLGLRWELNPRQIVSIGAGKHSQLLPVTEYFELKRLQDGTYYKPKKDTEMMQSYHLVAGFQQILTPQSHLKVETYYQRLSQIPVAAIEKNSYSMLNQGANFGVWAPDSVKSTGTGTNYGLELTLERFLHRGFYGLFTASVFDSKATGSDEVERNTAFNTNYVFNLLAGKEWNLPVKPGKNLKSQKLNVNIKSTWSGGQRYVPYAPVWNEQAQRYNRQFDYSQAFSKQYKDYFRTDLSISFKVNSGKITQEWAVEVTNLFGNKNIFNEKFNTRTGESSFNYQLPRMIIPQWIIHF